MTDATPLASEEITQEDREAAANYLDGGTWYEDSNLYPDSVREGHDDHFAIVQAFARHRIAALSATPAPSDQDASQAQGEVPAWQIALDEQETECRQLRKALIAMGRMIPGVLLADDVSSDFLATLPGEMAHYRLSPTPGATAQDGVENEDGPPDDLWGDPPTSPARTRLETLARRPDSWRHIYDKAVSPDPLDDLARDLREVLGIVNLLTGENHMTRNLEIKADEILRKHGSDMLWPRGPGRDTWAAAIRAVAEALETPAPNTFTLAEVQEMWRTGVETGGILAKKDGGNGQV